jgi:diguanylate cyclase (GGDEF)-like protein/PAS domain S-box-containing protein
MTAADPQAAPAASACEAVPADPVAANLDVLAALLNLEDDENSFHALFAALAGAIAFDRAMVLEDTHEGLHCVAASRAQEAGRHWAERSLQDAMQVRAHAPDDAADGLLAGLVQPGEPALAIPVGVSGRRALLVLVRAPGAARFDDRDIALARQYAAVALATVIARKAGRIEAEVERLNRLIEDCRAGEARARHDHALLKQIVDHLPISLTVQDEDGRFVLANALAAANLATPAEVLVGATPGDFLSEKDAASRRDWERGILRGGEATTVEISASDAPGGRTWVSSHTPVKVNERTLLVSSSVDITERKAAERALAERVRRDELTGLPDRVAIEERVESLLRRDGDGHRFALAFIDLDNFKHVNDYYSHAVGDALLVKLAQRIAGGLRAGDMLARISGDEFLALIDLAEGDTEPRAVIEEILGRLKDPFHIEAFEIFCSCSIGVCLHPDHGRSYEVLRRNADGAMYRAKHVAKGGAVYYDPDVGQAISARMEIEQRLRLAIRDHHFRCAFQPKVDIHTQQVIGFETLIRWRDDNGEIRAPGEFIGLAVELGLINPITNFVLAEAVGSIDRLDAAFGAGTTISVNVAAAQAGDLEFMRSFTQALKDSNHADRIIVELTEDAFVSKGTFQTQVLPMLRELGVRVSIDDFGTGYSSLSMLADIIADEIKIDRSFITAIHERPRNQSVLRAIESLGRALGMTIVAEGVETFEELAYLQAATRIRYAQGFYFAKPIYLDELIGARARDVASRASESTREQSEPKAASRLVAPGRAG